MTIINHNTKLFKNIFSDYTSFSNWYQTVPLCDGLTDVPNIKTFTLIANEFNDSSVSYSVESFKQRFSNDLYTFYKEFEMTTEAIIKLMNLQDDDISISDTMITNVAETPTTNSSTDIESFDYTSGQQKTIQKKGILQITKEQVSNKRAFTTKTFLNRFRHLFIRIISPAFTYVVEEPDDEIGE